QDDTQDGPPAVAGEFRPLLTDFEFDKPGIYKVRAVFAKPSPEPPDAETIRRMEKLGISKQRQMRQFERWRRESLPRAASNVVEIEVSP
ncbi:MAG: hypothetical protein KGL53_10835, partial [Elusimicrobia bacterium]|nr:hypothetical protein [Elusimicrobiota bacterium]